MSRIYKIITKNKCYKFWKKEIISGNVKDGWGYSDKKLKAKSLLESAEKHFAFFESINCSVELKKAIHSWALNFLKEYEIKQNKNNSIQVVELSAHSNRVLEIDTRKRLEKELKKIQKKINVKIARSKKINDKEDDIILGAVDLIEIKRFNNLFIKLNELRPAKFQLLKMTLNIKLARIFLMQAINSSFGFAENLRRIIFEKNIDIETLSLEDIKHLIDSDESASISLPESFYCFKNDFDRMQSVNLKEDINTIKLYTGVVSCSYDEGGLVVMECFNSQIYLLCDAEGNVLSDYCHDLEIGPNGIISCRLSNSDGSWMVGRYKKVNEPMFVLNPQADWKLNYVKRNGRLFWYNKNINLFELYYDGCGYFKGRDSIPGISFSWNLESKNSDTLNKNKYSLSNSSFLRNSIGEIKKIIIQSTPQSIACSPSLIPFYNALNTLAIEGIKKDFRVYTLLSYWQKKNKSILTAFLNYAPFEFIFITLKNKELASILNENNYLCLKWLKQSAKVYEFINEKLRIEDEFVLTLIKNHPSSGNMLPEKVKANDGLMTECIKINGSLLKYASSELKNNRTAVLLAISNKVESLRYVSNELINDEEFVREVIKKTPQAFKYISDKFKSNLNLISYAKKMGFIDSDAPKNDNLPF